MDAAMQCESVGCEIISHKKIKNPKNTEKGKLLYKFHKRRFKKSQSINKSLWSKFKKIIIMKILPTLGQVGEERPSLKTSLPYCQAVIYEIQRLAAVAPQSIPHRVTQVPNYIWNLFWSSCFENILNIFSLLLKASYCILHCTYVYCNCSYKVFQPKVLWKENKKNKKNNLIC